MLNFALWLVGSRAGRLALLTGAGVLGLLAIALHFYRRGRDGALAAAAERHLDAIETTISVYKGLARLGPHARREQLRRWVQG